MKSHAMLARSRFRAIQSISRRNQYPSSTRTWQPLLSRPDIISRSPAAQKCFYSDPTRFPPNGFQGRSRNRFRDSPLATSVWTFIVLGVIVYSGLTLRKRSEYKEAVRKIYPDPVAKELDEAIWYTNERQDCRKAIAHYNEAITLAQKLGLPPLSPEVLGIRIRIAETWEIFNKLEQAITTLKDIKTDCQEYLAGESGQILHPERTKLLITTVRTCMKIAQLYNSEALQNSTAAGPLLSEGIEVILREQIRMKEQGLSFEDLDPLEKWFVSEEVGIAFEMLAHHYAEQEQFQYAEPLLARALVYARNNCHTAIMLSQLGMIMAENEYLQGSDSLRASENPLSGPISCLEQAVALAREIAPPERTEECDETCVMATYNLAQFALACGRLAEGKRLCLEALSLAQVLNQQDHVQRIQRLLRRLDEKAESVSIHQHGSSMVDER